MRELGEEFSRAPIRRAAVDGIVHKVALANTTITAITTALTIAEKFIPSSLEQESNVPDATSRLTVRHFDGARQEFPKHRLVLITTHAGNKQEIFGRPVSAYLPSRAWRKWGYINESGELPRPIAWTGGSQRASLKGLREKYREVFQETRSGMPTATAKVIIRTHH